MQCKQLNRLIKDWYVHVKDETMAPARMMQFVDAHIERCDVCLEDNELPVEIEKIREFVVPESKIPKAIRAQPDKPTPEISPEEDEEIEANSENSNNNNETEEADAEDHESLIEPDDLGWYLCTPDALIALSGLPSYPFSLFMTDNNHSIDKLARCSFINRG